MAPIVFEEEALRELAEAHDYSAHRIAAHLGISLRQLQRSFKAHWHCSPCAWLREQRLLQARRMLLEASSVKWVAYTLGFSQLSQFCRDFKLRFGYPPSAALREGAARRQARERANEGQDADEPQPDEPQTAQPERAGEAQRPGAPISRLGPLKLLNKRRWLRSESSSSRAS
jgi:AraC-like DNA-binding protein